MGFVEGIVSHPTSKNIFERTDVGKIYRWDAVNSKWLPVADRYLEEP